MRISDWSSDVCSSDLGRYLQEKLGEIHPINPNLQQLLELIVADPRWDVTYLGMQIIVEGLALAAFGLIHQFSTEPLIKQITRYVMADEARHVAFGALALSGFYDELTTAERAERQEDRKSTRLNSSH